VQRCSVIPGRHWAEEGEGYIDERRQYRRETALPCAQAAVSIRTDPSAACTNCTAAPLLARSRMCIEPYTAWLCSANVAFVLLLPPALSSHTNDIAVVAAATISRFTTGTPVTFGWRPNYQQFQIMTERDDFPWIWGEGEAFPLRRRLYLCGDAGRCDSSTQRRGRCPHDTNASHAGSTPDRRSQVSTGR
jgi:hypothetical protein